ncbi:MAG: hypothetical protein NTY12_02605 [Candidatus Falkowbacteria bacterium]|nr:hypothetical protein [Candidatus Falkowbacteria bacterium]
MNNELLKHYSADEQKELLNNSKETDVLQRVANQEKTEELLKNSSYPNIEAKNILSDLAKSKKKKNETLFNDDYTNMMETYVERGTAEAIFYKTMIKEANIGVWYEENLEMLDGDGDNISISDERDKALVKTLLENPVIKFLINAMPDKEFEGKTLEFEELIPENTTERVLIRLYQKHIIRCNEMIRRLGSKTDKKRYTEERDVWQKRLDTINQDNKFTAISDKELEDIMRKIIQEELKNK